MLDELQNRYLTVVCDQAIYAKVQHIRWKDDEMKEKLIIRLGAFHAIMSFCGTIGKRFNNSGFQDILVESDVIGPSSINGIVSGKHYNRCMTVHKVLYEALERMRFSAFLRSLDDIEEEHIRSFIERFRGNVLSSEQVCQSPVMELISERYANFVNQCREINPTFDFWSSYIDMVGCLLLFVRATRTNNWDLHIATIRDMLPWYFAYDRPNYSRYLTTYWLEMKSLEETHPGALEEVKSNWTVQRQGRYGFSSVPCDMTIEQTANRDAKIKGGLVGFTLNRGYIHRWLLSQPERSAISRKCEELAGTINQNRKRKNLDCSSRKRHEQNVQNVICTLESMVNPFEYFQPNLVNVSTGRVVNSEALDDIIRAEELGTTHFINFVEKNLMSQSPDLFKTIKKLNLKSFVTKEKRKDTATTSLKDSKSTRDLYARALLLSENRDIDLEQLLSYSLSQYPASFATPEGNLRKTVKSKLLHILEAVDTPIVREGIKAEVIIVDAMAHIQMLKNPSFTFGQLALQIFNSLVHMGGRYNAKRVDFVGDRYFPTSIKNAERARRSSERWQSITILHPNQKVPTQWRKYLSVGENKENLLSFLATSWREYRSEQLKNITMFVTNKDLCYKLLPATTPKDTLTSILAQELSCDHEEADTRLVLHSSHAAERFGSVLVNTPDTDVIVILVATYSSISSNLFVETGVGDRKRILDIKAIASSLSDIKVNSIIGFHAFTGCDTTSCFYGKGKQKCWQCLNTNISFQHAIGCIGDSECFDASTVEEFVCSLYGSSKKRCNEARVELFQQGKFAEELLPPTFDALQKHTKRANFQAYIWKRCLSQFIDAPDVKNHGWNIENDEIVVDWMDTDCAVEMLKELISCGCKSGCKKRSCKCLKNELSCTKICKCIKCENGKNDIAESSEEDCDDEVDVNFSNVDFLIDESDIDASDAEILE